MLNLDWNQRCICKYTLTVNTCIVRTFIGVKISIKKFASKAICSTSMTFSHHYNDNTEELSVQAMNQGR